MTTTILDSPSGVLLLNRDKTGFRHLQRDEMDVHISLDEIVLIIKHLQKTRPELFLSIVSGEYP